MVLHQCFLQDCCTVRCSCFLVEAQLLRNDSTFTSRTKLKSSQMLPGHVSGSRSLLTACQPHIASLDLGAALSIGNLALHGPFRVAEIFPGKRGQEWWLSKLATGASYK